MEDIAKGMRAAELQRRAERRAYLLKCIQNEASLLYEELSDEDAIIHEKAVDDLREQNLRLEKDVTPGYWQRIWAALWGH